MAFNSSPPSGKWTTGDLRAEDKWYWMGGTFKQDTPLSAGNLAAFTDVDLNQGINCMLRFNSEIHDDTCTNNHNTLCVLNKNGPGIKDSVSKEIIV